MTTAVANSPDQSLRQFLVYSVIMHASLALVIVVSAYIQFRDNRWGGPGGDIGTKVTLVSAPAAGIPMPKESVVTDSKAVDPTKGLYKEEPPKPPEPKTNRTKIPKFEKEKPLPPSRPSRTLENKSRIHDNAVHYGKRGNRDLPSGYSQTPGSGSPGGTVPGQGNNDFSTRYGWYIAAAKRRVAPNWNVLFLDPSVRNSQTLHCVISFTIFRDGTIKNLRVSHSSVNSSFDRQIVREAVKFSGILEVPSHTFSPPQAPSLPAELKPAIWIDPPTNANFLGFGNLAESNTEVAIEAWLYDVRNPSSQAVVGKVYRGAPTDLQVRKFAHQFADEIIAKLSGGLPGIALTQIAFVSSRGGSKEIWVMDYDGSNQHQLTSLKPIALTPRWSPDASRIPFTCFT